MQKNTTVIARFPFLVDQPRWKGAVEVVEREEQTEGEEPRFFSDVRLCFGSRTVHLPRRGLAEILEALRLAVDSSRKHYTELTTRLNKPAVTKARGRLSEETDG